MANDTILSPRDGHIDLPDGLCDASVGLSMVAGYDRGGPVLMLHLDVARGGDVEVPFSVGIQLTESDIAQVMIAMQALRNAAAHAGAERRTGLN